MLLSHSMNKCRPISTLNVLSAIVMSGFRFILSVMRQCWLNFSRKYILHSVFAQIESVRGGLCKDRRQNTIRTNRPSSVNKYFIKWLHLQWKRKWQKPENSMSFNSARMSIKSITIWHFTPIRAVLGKFIHLKNPVDKDLLKIKILLRSRYSSCSD